MPVPEIRAVTLDLDDTLWAIWPVIRRAEQSLQAWLARHAPATIAAHDETALLGFRDAVVRERPDWAHDLGAVRRETIRRALAAAGDDPALAEAAFEVFLDARHQVELFDDVVPALSALAARVPVVAVSNGNADLGRIGLGEYFAGAVSARSFGVGKPDPRIFHAACEMAGVAPAQVLHVGDDLHLDVRGALGAGLQAAWVSRPGLGAASVQGVPGVPRVDSLLALVPLVAGGQTMT